MSDPISGGAFPTSSAMASGASRHQGAFPDPFFDYASTQMPKSIYDVLWWCQTAWLSNGTLRQACQRVVRYFLTSIELQDVSDDEKKKYEEFINDELHLMDNLASIGDDFVAYGNSFFSLYVPFRRHLVCPKCRTERPLKEMNWSWSTDFKFHAICANPECKFSGEMIRKDRPSLKVDPVRIIRWSPLQIQLVHNQVTGDTRYYWQIPGYVKDHIKRGNELFLETTPWEIIEAAKTDRLFRFADDYIFHLKDDPLAGMQAFGWGIPLMMSNFKQVYYVQVLKRYNEAIALDYVIPFRVVTPVAGSNSREADPIFHINLRDFNQNVMSMISQHRRDPTTFHTLPFPVQLASLGGDARELAPNDLLDKGQDELLNASGVPADFYRGTLKLEASPVALRLFERTWVHYVNGLNRAIAWICKQVSQVRNWENLKARLQPITLADDLERKSVQLQLQAGQQISRQTAFAPFHINFREELRKMLQEEEFSQEETAKFQSQQAQKNQLQAAVLGQGGAPGGMPGAAPMPAGAAPGGGGGISPQDMEGQADQISTQLLAMPYELRRGEMLKIKKSNPTMHAVIVQKMGEKRQSAGTQGGFALLQQQVAGPGAGTQPAV